VDEAGKICQDETKEVFHGMEEQRVQTEREKPGMVVVRGKWPSCSMVDDWMIG